jgi:general stress protein YciG
MNGKNDKRGFAAMDSEKRKALASKGGKAAHAQGHAHEFNSEEARNAGSKGGKAIARDRDHMATIGRLGGLARRRRPAEKTADADGR